MRYRVAVVMLVAAAAAAAVAAEAPSWPKPGFADSDRDGVNDRFRDANGDGVDDVSGKPYPHRFGFEDRDRDGRNDLFRDEDGDGVNDLAGTRPRLVLVLDYDSRKINDVTGAKYSRTRLYGDSFGKVKEDSTMSRAFVDRDMDGINDLFVDEDGDGICDGRSLSRSSMGMGQDSGCASDRDDHHR